MKFLLDTCVISDFFKKNPGVVSQFQNHSPLELCISSISVMEVEYGLSINSERAVKLKPTWQAFLRQIQVIDYTKDDAYITASIRGYLKRLGKPIGPFDILLAGIALQRDLIFVSSNTSEFQRIPNLHLENWRS